MALAIECKRIRGSLVGVCLERTENEAKHSLKGPFKAAEKGGQCDLKFTKIIHLASVSDLLTSDSENTDSAML